MTKEKFLEELREVLQSDNQISEDGVLSEMEEWDSLSKMAVMAFFDKTFGVKISLKEIGRLNTVKDLCNLAKID